MTVIVSGMIAADPYQGGATWAVLQYVLGLLQLGHDVYFIEPIKEAAIRPAAATLAESVNARYFTEVATQFGLLGRAALLQQGTQQTHGLSYPQLQQIARKADVLLNISGMLEDPELLCPIPIRAYLDLDPAFNQLWNAVQGIDMRFGGHTHHVTIGQSIGSPECPIPTCGRDWIKTWQPIVLKHWPVAHQLTHPALTTIANWRGYGSIHHDGLHYGQKAHSLRPLLGLPRLTPEKLLLALSIHPGETRDLAALAENGWECVDPATVTDTPERYQQFIQGSWAEFGVAKSGYVHSRCGWFSDRSVCYLASGRPVLAQDTGLAHLLPTGEGLLLFASLEEAVAGIAELRRNYPAHAKRARAIAEEYFESDKVLTRLLHSLGAQGS